MRLLYKHVRLNCQHTIYLFTLKHPRGDEVKNVKKWSRGRPRLSWLDSIGYHISERNIWNEKCFENKEDCKQIIYRPSDRSSEDHSCDLILGVWWVREHKYMLIVYVIVVLICKYIMHKHRDTTCWTLDKSKVNLFIGNNWLRGQSCKSEVCHAVEVRIRLFGRCWD